MPSTVIEPFSTTYRDSAVGRAIRTSFPVFGRCPRDHVTGAVDVSLDDVSAEAAVDRRRALEVDVAADRDPAQARPVQGFVHDVGAECTVGQHLDHGQTDTVDRDRVAVPGISRDDGPPDDEAGGSRGLPFPMTSPSSSTIPVNTPQD